MTRSSIRIGFTIVVAAGLSGCDDLPPGPELTAPGADRVRVTEPDQYEFEAAVYDIAAAPDGSILVAQNTNIKTIRRGMIADVVTIPTVPGSPINGLDAIGTGNFFAASGGLDQAQGAGVWRVSPGGARLVADIEAFETANDPDAFEGTQWKDQRCEEDPTQGFTEGPQSNPYHLTALSGSDVLVADAAGNTLLRATTRGELDWVAVFTPPVDETGDPRVLFPLDTDTDCFVQPVPTSVAVAEDGALYVGELTGAPAVPGWSRVWRIEPGASNVVCPSDECREIISGLTSVIDLAFGPDGRLYVVEMDRNGWLGGLILGDPAGGTIQSCDVDTGTCETVAEDLLFPGAITFDKRGNLWLLENSIGTPVVRRLDFP